LRKNAIDGGGGQSTGGQYEVLGGFWAGGPLCLVEFEDYARLVVNWLDVEPGLAGDLDGDGDVDGADIGRFVDEWLYYRPYDWPLK
jgi:hypothetical protein